jgi:FAD/FMN-containing dehydrogenase
MSTMARKQLLEELEGCFGDRYEAHPGRTRGVGYDPVAVVSPVSVEEVELLAELAGRHSVRLAPEGAGTAPVPGRPPGEVSVRFDLMREVSVPRPPDHLVEVQPGMSWLQLEGHLRGHRRGLRVYPSSAPQATIGGWVALDGLGIGSFEYGRLWENVVSVDVVSARSGLRTVRGAELPQVIKPGYPEALVVGATLRTRQSDGDTPFAAAFDDPEDLTRAVSGIRQAGVRLWHLGLLNAVMAHARGQEGRCLLFGAYPAERGPEAEGPLWAKIEAGGGRRLPAAAAYRLWAERFFPVDPARATPFPDGMLVQVDRLASALQRFENMPEPVALQGSVSRSGEVVLLSLDAGNERGSADTARGE